MYECMIVDLYYISVLDKSDCVNISSSACSLTKCN